MMTLAAVGATKSLLGLAFGMQIHTKFWTFKSLHPILYSSFFLNILSNHEMNQMPLEAENDLISAALKQDSKAWQTLLSEHGGKMYGIALRFLSNEKEAEDVIQDSWILISQKLADFRGECKLGTWIYRITANKCLEKIRSRKKEKEKTESIDALLPDYQDDGHYKKEFTDWSQRPDKDADQKTLREAIEAALDSLPEEYREVLVLRDVQGFSGAETAEMLGINEATMKTKLHRARMAIREKLERKYGKKPWNLFLRMLL